MEPLTLQATLSGLLYRVPDAAARAGADAPQVCIPAFAVPEAVLAWAGYIAAGGRQPQDPNRDPARPLASIFTHLNGEHPGWYMPPRPQNGRMQLPVTAQAVTPADYAKALQPLADLLQNLPQGAAGADALLNLLEVRFGCFPADTSDPENADVSLYDQAKITAAVAACAAAYYSENQQPLPDTAAGLDDAPIFMLYSADFSRIQKFIYTVRTAGALVSLRSRSFFLDFLMEHYLDELLDACGVTRANLIYSGGGRSYALLPNTDKARVAAEAWNRAFNQWLREQFGTQLYLAGAMEPCTGAVLMNKTADGGYSKVFRDVNHSLDERKHQSCTAADLLALNRAEEHATDRECAVCGTAAAADSELCPWCALFTELSADIQKKDVLLISRTKPRGGTFCALPAYDGSTKYLFLTDEKQLPQDDILRLYTKNAPLSPLPRRANLCVGDYAWDNRMEKLVDGAQGIRRIAVCRMDVDNLGQAFIAGFDAKRVSLARAGAFSRRMSLFFKGYINEVLQAPEPLRLAIVYAGGDDVFLVGAWNDVLTGALRIHDRLAEFSCGALTISAGVGIFDEHFPIRVAAARTAELEDTAKEYPDKENPTKNAVCLFAPESAYACSWQEFAADVMGEKLTLLQAFFDAYPERGNSFLYRLLELLRETENNKINLARYAYLLARMSPQKADGGLYDRFARSMMDWGRDAGARNRLILAIYIYVYQNREVKPQNEQ